MSPPPDQRPATLKRQGLDHLRFPTCPLCESPTTRSFLPLVGLHHHHPPVSREAPTRGKSDRGSLHLLFPFLVLGTSRPDLRLSSIFPSAKTRGTSKQHISIFLFLPLHSAVVEIPQVRHRQRYRYRQTTDDKADRGPSHASHGGSSFLRRAPAKQSELRLIDQPLFALPFAPGLTD